MQQYFTSHPALAPWLNHLGLFNVFAAPWFAAIYLLLFASLVGCVVPRTFRLAGLARARRRRARRGTWAGCRTRRRTRPRCRPGQPSPPPPRCSAGKRFRLRRPRPGDDGGRTWVSAEKGYLREAGNLLFHLALLGVLVSIALGGLFGYKADKLMVEGQTFSDTMTALDEFHPGRLVTRVGPRAVPAHLEPVQRELLTSGESRGQPSSFDAARLLLARRPARPPGPTTSGSTSR